MPGGMAQTVTGMGQPIADNEKVQALLVILKENGSPGCREFEELIGHISGMERQLSDAMEELQAIRQKMQDVQDRSLKAVLQKGCKAMEENTDAMRRRLTELKGQIVEGCRNILADLKERGTVALNGIAHFLHLKSALEAVRAVAEDSIQAGDRAAARIDAFSSEFHEAGRHIKNMGRSLRGEPAEAEAKETGRIAGAFKGAFKVERAFASAVSRKAELSLDALARLEQAAERRLSVLAAMKEQAANTGPAKERQEPSRDKGSR